MQKALEPMGAADRKVVHDTANEIDGVSTISEGEDPRRRVVILPVDGLTQVTRSLGDATSAMTVDGRAVPTCWLTGRCSRCSSRPRPVGSWAPVRDRTGPPRPRLLGAPTDEPRQAVDLGSGGGIPGLVLARHGWPRCRWQLLEAGARRSDFLRQAVADLGSRIGWRWSRAGPRRSAATRSAATWPIWSSPAALAHRP